ncbi:endo-1,4-beta-xylanase [Gaetbulibacter aestuarii]|uniref:endo-1,4-beta-xylanase n=1 Tax=Gaetbulibacter aestuarii TaxID=1502358 RepID=A0ABW7MWF3_9FLAO
MNQKILYFLFICTVFSGFSQEEKAIDKIKSIPPLRVGATLNYEELGTKKEKLFLKDFKYLTPANAAKQTRVHPKPGEWDWTELNDFIDFANDHHLVVRLHSPVSPQASKWAKADHRTPEELSKIMEEYMMAITQKFNNESCVKYMDVVNETILGDGSWFGPKEGTHQWENPWLKMGYDENGYPLYILKAFEIATKYGSNKELVYNQNVGMETPMWNKVKETVLYLRSKGYRVDGIGWQAHLLLGAKRKDFVDNMDETIQKLSDLIDWAHSHDLAFHITELDYLVRNNEADQLKSERQIQKKVYDKIVDVLIEKSKQGEVTLNLWDLSVRPKKGTGNFQSIYDNKFKPIPAYYSVQKALKVSRNEI